MALQFLNACFFFYKVWLGSIGNDGTDGHVDSIKLLLNNPKYANHNSELGTFIGSPFNYGNVEYYCMMMYVVML